MKNPFRRPARTTAPAAPAFSHGDTQPITVGSWHAADADDTAVLRDGRPRSRRRLATGLVVGAVAGIGLAFTVPALADSGTTDPQAATSSAEGAVTGGDAVTGGGATGEGGPAAGDTPAAGTGSEACPAPPEPPAAPAAPEGGEVPAPPSEGEVPAPPVEGEVPAPPAPPAA